MSKIKNGGLDQYGAEPFEPQQFGISGVDGVKLAFRRTVIIALIFTYTYGYLQNHWLVKTSALLN